MEPLNLNRKPPIEKWTPFSSFEKCSPLLKNYSQKINSAVANCYQYLWFSFSYLLSGCPMANFGILSRRKPYSINVNHCIYQLSSHAGCIQLFTDSFSRFLLPISHVLTKTLHQMKFLYEETKRHVSYTSRETWVPRFLFWGGSVIQD